MLLNRVSPDLDFAVPSNGISLARRVANALNADFMVLDDERDTGRVIVTESDGTRTFLDFATYRGRNLEEDLRARDFTMNAIAFNLQDQTLIDPLNGASDLRNQANPRLLPHFPDRMTRSASCAPYDRRPHSDSRSSLRHARR